MRSNWSDRRSFIRAVGATGVLALAGCSGGGDGGDGGSDGQTGDGGGENAGASGDSDGNMDVSGGDGGGGCSAGHTSGDPVCQQVADDAESLTEFPASGTGLLTTFDYPCGWSTSTTGAVPDRFQANVEREQIGGEDGGYALVMVQNNREPVEEGFLDETKSAGQYEELEYEYDGETRTGLVSAKSTAKYGTIGHATLPFEGSLIHVRLVSTLKAETCDVEPMPDYGLVKDMLRSLEPNPDSSFSTA